MKETTNVQSAPQKCGICGKSGHKRGTCRERISPVSELLSILYLSVKEWWIFYFVFVIKDSSPDFSKRTSLNSALGGSRNSGMRIGLENVATNEPVRN